MFAVQHEPNLCAVPLKLNSAVFALVLRLYAHHKKLQVFLFSGFT